MVIDRPVIEPLINVLTRSIRRGIFNKYDGRYLVIVESPSSDVISLLLVGISAVVLKEGLLCPQALNIKVKRIRH